MALSKTTKEHFLLLKKSGFSASGESMSALESAKALLDCGFWPLHKHTPCKNMVQPGHRVLVYLSGSAEPGGMSVVASATIASTAGWTPRLHRDRYPLLLEGEPFCVLNLTDIAVFDKPVDLKSRVSKLSFFPKNNPAKWGAVMMGGMKSLTKRDFAVLSQQDPETKTVT